MYTYTDKYDKISLIFIIFVIVIGCIAFIGYEYQQYKLKRYLQDNSLKDDNEVNIRGTKLMVDQQSREYNKPIKFEILAKDIC